MEDFPIFISYSRLDIEQVRGIKASIEESMLVRCWMDLNAIESGSKRFTCDIISGINSCKVFLFMLSENSQQSEFALRELEYANKKGKHVVIVNINDCKLTDEFQFLYGLTDTILWLDILQREKMLRDLKRWTCDGSRPNIEFPKAQRNVLEAQETTNSTAKHTKKGQHVYTRSAASDCGHGSSYTQNFKPKSKKWLWIGSGGVIVVMVVLVLVMILIQSPNADLSASGSYNGHDYVDLGLPSGTLWATCNIGSDTPMDFGNYYAWGETQPRALVNGNHYKYAQGYYYNTITKYCNDSYYGYNGFTDTLTLLQANDDAATSIWGNGWRIPSKKQWEELILNTTNSWTIQCNVNGWLFTSNNGNCLFIPAAGLRSGDNDYNVKLHGDYWSNTLNLESPWCSYAYCFSMEERRISFPVRSEGCSIRPVCSAIQN